MYIFIYLDLAFFGLQRLQWQKMQPRDTYVERIACIQGRSPGLLIIYPSVLKRLQGLEKIVIPDKYYERRKFKRP
jgi:hypothetical protein